MSNWVTEWGTRVHALELALKEKGYESPAFMTISAGKALSWKECRLYLVANGHAFSLPEINEDAAVEVCRQLDSFVIVIVASQTEKNKERSSLFAKIEETIRKVKDAA